MSNVKINYTFTMKPSGSLVVGTCPQCNQVMTPETYHVHTLNGRIILENK